MTRTTIFESVFCFKLPSNLRIIRVELLFGLLGYEDWGRSWWRRGKSSVIEIRFFGDGVNKFVQVMVGDVAAASLHQLFGEDLSEHLWVIQN